MVGRVYNQMKYNYTSSPLAEFNIKNKLLCAAECANQFPTCNTAVFDAAVVPQCLLFNEPLIPAQLVVVNSAVVYDFQQYKLQATTITASILTTTTTINTTSNTIINTTTTPRTSTATISTTTNVSIDTTTNVTSVTIINTTTTTGTSTTIGSITTTITKSITTSSTTIKSTTTTTGTSTSTTTTETSTTATTTVTVSLSLYGVQLNLNPSSLSSGWTRCYNTTYATVLSTSNVAIILTSCSKSKLLLGCRPIGNTVLTVAAMGNRADVLYNCGNITNCTHVANGVGWYFSNSYSWGFANSGDAVIRNQCDEESTDTAYRLCWHTYGGNGGYRCGATIDLNSNATWERVIYHGA